MSEFVHVCHFHRDCTAIRTSDRDHRDSWNPGSADSAISALFGGLAVILPTVVFTGLAFRHAGARNARSIVRSFYLGESLKLVLTAGLLVCVFVWVDPLVPGAVFGSFIAMQLACGVSLTRLKALPNRRQ